MAENVDPLNWSVDMEVSLFHAMRGHKPVGVNRFFQMICIHEKLNNASSKKIPISDVWKHLGEMYDLMALNESEIFPFPNRICDFELNGNEYGNLLSGEFPRYKPGAFSSLDENNTSETSRLLSTADIKTEEKGLHKIQLKDISSSLSNTSNSGSTSYSPSSSSSTSLVSTLSSNTSESSKRKRTRQGQTPGVDGAPNKRARTNKTHS
ncbi:MRG/MORF4L-binding protein [Octopus bimaculoides]|uniref:MRG-binding protein n=1 Tax=Octopus bimaculoides TaxID=37653 RepID=A0A0L8GZL8_OCTBM|nr:MRG/MORF4L-binding protein [Octopus bimaculoides]|eukprot:XP_014776732.1 PREDICTED: MRG/MORF4L-binding protein-like [Octopus bimaculoides]